MKHLVLFLGFVTVLAFNSGNAQEIKPQELLGTWDKTDTTKEKLSFDFQDRSNLVVEGYRKTDKFSYKLIKDSLTKSPMIVMEMDKQGVKQTTHYIIEHNNSDTLKLTAPYANDKSVQLPSDLNKGSFYLVRRKQK